MNGVRPKIGATAMVFGFDMHENLTKLAQYVRHAELLLYWTPTANNFPAKNEIKVLNNLAQELNLSLSVHLPPMLDLINATAAQCQANLALLIDLIQNMESLAPTAYVLHLGPNPPSLCANPKQYLYADTPCDLTAWYNRGFAALAYLQTHTGLGRRLLLENLDFSPLLLQPFLAEKLAGLCLDIGHMWLGREPLMDTIPPLQAYIGEIHLHGVSHNLEHISLQAVTVQSLTEFGALVGQLAYAGLINLEVFSPNDFRESLATLKELLPYAGLP